MLLSQILILLGSKYFEIFSSTVLSDSVLIKFVNIVLPEFHFFEILVNLICLPSVVVINSLSFRLEKGKSSFIQTIQNHWELSFLSISYVCLFIRLHSICIQISHLSHLIDL